MRFFLLAIIAAITLVGPNHIAVAQDAEMPVPGLVVKDADGKVMGQVDGFLPGTSGTLYPVVVFNIEGSLAFLVYRPYGLIDGVAHAAGNLGGPTVYFSGSDCTGNSYVNIVHPDGVEAQSGYAYGVGGPDPTSGEYKLYRSNTLAAGMSFVTSKWEGGTCRNYGPTDPDVLSAEEVVPNPLAGFHGPTTANPERVLTIEGGTRLP